MAVQNTGYKAYQKLGKVTNDGTNRPLDINNNLCSETGLPQDIKNNNVSDPNYIAPVLDLQSCPIPVVIKWIGGDPVCETNSPVSYQYDISQGTRICKGGYVDISTNTTTIFVFSATQRVNWEEGTKIYKNEDLTIPLENGFYRSITGGNIDLFFFQITSGTIVEKIMPLTGC